MSNDRSFIYSVAPEILNLPAGVTLTISALPGQNAAVIKHIAGGSLAIYGVTSITGMSYSVGSYFPMSTNETLNLDLSGSIVVVATGSTCVFSLLRGRTSGF